MLRHFGGLIDLRLTNRERSNRKFSNRRFGERELVDNFIFILSIQKKLRISI